MVNYFFERPARMVNRRTSLREPYGKQMINLQRTFMHLRPISRTQTRNAGSSFLRRKVAMIGIARVIQNGIGRVQF